MARLLFVLHHSTEDPDRAATGLQSAAAAAAAGHEVALWLTHEGARLGVKGVAETMKRPGPDLALTSLQTVVARGGVLLVSQPCFERRAFEADQLREGAVLAPPETLAAKAAEGWTPLPA